MTKKAIVKYVLIGKNMEKLGFVVSELVVGYDEQNIFFEYEYHHMLVWGPSTACVQAGSPLFHVINMNTH